MYGSISHKQNIGIALVSKNNNDDTAGVGIDIEFISRPGKRSIAKRVLTKNETKALGNIPGITAEEEVMLRFRYERLNSKGWSFVEVDYSNSLALSPNSLKEAIYKAAHPLLCQYVNFKDAEVTPSPDGTATCIWFLESGAHENIVDMKAHWQKVDDQDQGYFLTSARVQGHLQNENDEECIPK
jgi:4'-phosphopantetheinyl transferase EntD